ncbi:MAG: SurA N-terminal domain-containing protein [Campylobacter sp.]|nr:SurA N-terminal domain-containing protein [Campylobacter sp.]
MKRVFILLLLCVAFGNAKVVNWVVALVENEPITNYEIQNLMKKGRMSEQQAVNYLVDQKLFEAQVKKLGIKISPTEIEDKITEIKIQNNMDDQAFRASLMSQNIDYADFRKDIEENIKKEKLLASVFSKADSSATPENVRRFYERNKNLFTDYTSISITRYFSPSQSALAAIARGGEPGRDVVYRTFNVPKKDLDPRTAEAFGSFKNGTFTPIVPSFENLYEMLKINSKQGVYTKSFEEVEKEAFTLYVRNERKKESDEFFAKLRSNAIVKFVDKPSR